MTLRVAFVNSLPGWGGGEKWFLEAARAMHQRGHFVLVVGQPDGELVRRAREAGLRAAGIRMHGIADPRTLLSLAWRLRRDRVGIAVTNQAREIRLVGLSQTGRRDFRLVARRGSPDPIKDVWHFRFVYTRWVDHLLVNCEALVGKVLAGAEWFPRERVSVLHNGVDLEALPRGKKGPGLREELGIGARPLVSMVGEVGWRKDQRTLLGAVAALRDREALFVIVGEGPLRPELERMARDLGVEGRVRWLGFRRDATEILAASDLVVLPSREEGFPNTLLEAMALGRCVLATPVDGIVELVRDGENGVLAPVGDVRVWAERIDALLADRARRDRLGAAAALTVRDSFDQRRVMDRFEERLRAIAG